MSNHSGSYMLNDVLKELNNEGVFKYLGEQKTQDLTIKFLKIASQYDCNPGEILEDLGSELGICPG